MRSFILSVFIIASLFVISCTSNNQSSSGGITNCASNSDCATGESCYLNICRKSCAVSADCGTNEVCSSGVCLPSTGGGDTDFTADSDLEGNMPESYSVCLDNQTVKMCNGDNCNTRSCLTICGESAKESQGCKAVTENGKTIEKCVCVSADGDVDSTEKPDTDLQEIEFEPEIEQTEAEEGESTEIEDEAETEQEVDCTAVCKDHCGSFKGCACDDCSGGKVCRDNICVEPKVCSIDSQCGNKTCDAWKACGSFDFTCDTLGTKTRDCYQPICPDGACSVFKYIEEQACNRDTTNTKCGENRCESYGECIYLNECSSTGAKCRMCYPQVCQGGSCVDGPGFEDCTTSGCDRTTEDNYCDTETGTSTGKCKSDKCTGVWYDDSTKLYWQLVPNSGLIHYNALSFHCELIVLDGYDDWRTPTIEEMRTIVAGCDKIATGGACSASSSCYTSDCRNSHCTSGCTLGTGPNNGCFMNENLLGGCEGIYGVNIIYPYFGFKSGHIGYNGGADRQVRCVRKD